MSFLQQSNEEEMVDIDDLSWILASMPADGKRELVSNASEEENQEPNVHLSRPNGSFDTRKVTVKRSTGYQVEVLNAFTHERVEVFPSVRKASLGLEIARRDLDKLCRSGELTGGLFLRFAGDPEMPGHAYAEDLLGDLSRRLLEKNGRRFKNFTS